MDNKAILKEVKEWVKQRGRRHVLIQLLSRGVSFSTAEKLAAGRYSSNPQDMLAQILREEIEKDTRNAS